MNPALVSPEYFDLLPVQVWTARVDGSLDFVNRAVADYFGVGRQQLLDQGWKDLCHPLDLICAGEKWRQSLDSGHPYEIYFRLLSGSDRQFHWHVGRATPVRSAQGDIEYWMGCNTDIDMVKREQEVSVAAAAQWRAQIERDSGSAAGT